MTHVTPTTTRILKHFLAAATALTAALSSYAQHGDSHQNNSEPPAATLDNPAAFDFALATEASLLLPPADALKQDASLRDLWTYETAIDEEIDPIIKAARQSVRDARAAARSRDFKLAEERFIVALARDLTPKERHDTLLQMALMYEDWSSIKFGKDQGKLTREKIGDAISLYEKFIDTYPRSPHNAVINMRLGQLYRFMGAYKMAISRFYDVIGSSLKIDPDNKDLYADISLKAKMEIARTHYEMGEFDVANTMFKNLRKLDLTTKDRMEVEFHEAYTNYLLEDYTKTQGQMERFLQVYEDSIYRPKAWFVLANTYRALNQNAKAITAVQNLLGDSKERSEQEQEVWFYWQKRASNQLANELYEQGDYPNALRIYTAMTEISDDPEWLAQAMYQVALCFERLRLTQKAESMYEAIIAGSEWENVTNPSEHLQAVQEMAKFRKDSLQWHTDAEQRLMELINKSSAGS